MGGNALSVCLPVVSVFQMVKRESFPYPKVLWHEWVYDGIHKTVCHTEPVSSEDEGDVRIGASGSLVDATEKVTRKGDEEI